MCGSVLQSGRRERHNVTKHGIRRRKMRLRLVGLNGGGGIGGRDHGSQLITVRLAAPGCLVGIFVIAGDVRVSDSGAMPNF